MSGTAVSPTGRRSSPAATAASVALAFAHERAEVLISYLGEEEDARETQRLVEQAGHRAMLVPGDIGDPAHARAVIARAVEAFGRIDVLVNNAAHQPNEQLLAYATTKGAIHDFTVGLGQMLAERGIRGNAVAPGPVWTPLIASTMPSEKVKTFGETTPIGRAVQPAKLAPAYVMLAGDEASYILAAPSR